MLNDVVLKCMHARFTFENIHVMNFSDKPFRSAKSYLSQNHLYAMFGLSSGMARLCFIALQPSQFLLRLRIDRCSKKVVTLALYISDVKHGTVTHERLLNTAFYLTIIIL